jgi:hypothetical protein
MKLRLAAAFVLIAALRPQDSFAASPEQSRADFSFYPGVVVTAIQHGNGDLSSFVRTPAGKAVQGSLHLDRRRRSATWVGQSAAGAGALRHYDLSSPDRRRVLAAHTLQSVALSALLHYEDQQRASTRALAGKASIATATGGSCTPVTDGCSNWFDECGGISTRPACEAHDACYQCALGTRRECDRQLYNDVVTLTNGDHACAAAYYLGVRLIGWMVYQDPNLRPYLGPDMYSLGISLTACDGYEYLCTTYLF